MIKSLRNAVANSKVSFEAADRESLRIVRATTERRKRAFRQPFLNSRECKMTKTQQQDFKTYTSSLKIYQRTHGNVFWTHSRHRRFGSIVFIAVLVALILLKEAQAFSNTAAPNFAAALDTSGSSSSSIVNATVTKVSGSVCSKQDDPCPLPLVCSKSVCRCRPIYGYAGDACSIAGTQTWVGFAYTVINLCGFFALALKTWRYVYMHIKYSRAGQRVNPRGAVLTLWLIGAFFGVFEEITFVVIRLNFLSPADNQFVDNTVQGVIETVMGVCTLVSSFVLASTWLGIVASTKTLSQQSKSYLLRARKYIMGFSFVFIFIYPTLSFLGQHFAASVVMSITALIVTAIFHYGGSTLATFLEQTDSSLPHTASPGGSKSMSVKQTNNSRATTSRPVMSSTSAAAASTSSSSTSKTHVISRATRLKTFSRYAALTLLGFVVSTGIYAVTAELPITGYIPMIMLEGGFTCLVSYGWRSVTFTSATLVNSASSGSAPSSPTGRGTSNKVASANSVKYPQTASSSPPATATGGQKTPSQKSYTTSTNASSSTGLTLSTTKVSVTALSISSPVSPLSTAGKTQPHQRQTSSGSNSRMTQSQSSGLAPSSTTSISSIYRNSVHSPVADDA